jgi:hypothetical protein
MEGTRRKIMVDTPGRSTGFDYVRRLAANP